MSPRERNWHNDFVDYAAFIASHPNYQGMSEPFKNDGMVRWIPSCHPRDSGASKKHAWTARIACSMCSWRAMK